MCGVWSLVGSFFVFFAICVRVRAQVRGACVCVRHCIVPCFSSVDLFSVVVRWLCDGIFFETNGPKATVLTLLRLQYHICFVYI